MANKEEAEYKHSRYKKKKMIRVEGIEKEYVLDLNEKDGNDFELLVVSKGKDGVKHSMWGIDMKSSDEFTAEVIGKNTLSISTNGICSNEYLWLRNLSGDKYKIAIIPNNEATNYKTYVFNATWMDENNIQIESEVNGEPCEWTCTHDAFPLNMLMSEKEGNGNAIVTIVPMSVTSKEVQGFFEFTQEGSEEVARVRFSQDGEIINTIK